MKTIDLITFHIENLKPNIYKKEDFLTGKVYDELLNALNLGNENELRNIICGFINFITEKNNNTNELIDIFKKADSSNNIKNNVEISFFPLGMLILKIGLFTKNKLTFLYSFNLLLNLTFISHEFCQGITNEININEILEKLIYFYPLFGKFERINNNNKFIGINIKEEEKAESYYFGSQILKLLGNLFASSNIYESFEALDFYEKIFYLLSEFNLDYDNKFNLSLRYDYLDTLIWLIYLFFIKVENISIKYYDIIINFIPKLLNYIRALYYSNETELLNKILYLIEYLSDVNDKFIIKIVDSDGVKIIINLFGYLFNSNNETGEIILTDDIIDRIIIIFANISTLESKYLQKIDFTLFALVFEKLFSIYKMDNNNHYNIQSNLILILSNLACYNDIEDIINKMLMNKKVIKDLFNYYYRDYSKQVLLFIDNIMIKQHKQIRDNILNMGALDIIKKNICNFDGDKNSYIKESIKVLYNLIKAEKAFNIRLLFEKLYNTSIPEKVKQILFNKDFPEDIEEILKLIINDFEKYEKSLEN